MATLVLTSVGSLLGPVGGAVGALIGQTIDRTLLAPKGRRGARLGDLTVQMSRYGAPIPKLFGRMRVAGTVIWSTDLIESQQRSGGGKSGPKTTNYSYSASFAVALSARPIIRVERIWADGKLLRGSAGDWKTETRFRLHLGSEDQEADPLIASAEGIGTTPAYRGIAYAVFEGLQLADFGNRIPSITLEVVADEEPVQVGAIAGALAEGAVTGETETALTGYAALGDSVRGAIQGIGEAVPLIVADDGVSLALREMAGEPVALPDTGERPRIERRAAGTLPDEVSIQYHEPARDYQAGLQRARRGGPGRRVEAIELAASLDAGAAKALAEGRLRRDWAARTTASVSLPWRHLAVAPGDAVTLPGRGERWRVTASSFERNAVRLELVAEAGAAGLAGPASPGRAAQAEDRAHGATTVALLDLPALDGAAADAPRLWIAAAGASPGWRRAEFMATMDGGTSWSPIGGTAAPATMGVAASALPPGGAALLDDRAVLDVALLHDGMALSGSDGLVRSATVNLALVGDELIQFSRAERIAPATWRLSGLLRGRRGTERATAGHAAGERFVLIEPGALTTFEPPAGAIGANVRVAAKGVGDFVPVEANMVLLARGLCPPAPVRLAARRLGDGTVEMGWIRRSRLGFAWLDGADAPLGQTVERYRVRIVTAGGAGRTIETIAPAAAYPVAAQTADGAGVGAVLTIAVAQAGELGSWSAETSITLS